MPAAGARVVHFAYDTLPRVLTDTRSEATTVELRVPFRIETFAADQLRIVSWRFLVQVNGIPWTVPSGARRITRETVELSRRQMRDHGQFRFDRLPPYLDMADRMDPGVQYLEGAVPDVPRGARVEYRLEVSLQRDQQPPFRVSSRSYTTYATDPGFGADDIVRVHIPEPGRALQAWALYRRRESGFEHLRLDVVSLAADPEAHHGPAELAELTIRLGDRMIDLRNPELAVLPMVNTATDSVTVSVPAADGPLGAVTVRHAGRRADRRSGRAGAGRPGPGDVHQLRHPGPQRLLRHRDQPGRARASAPHVHAGDHARRRRPVQQPPGQHGGQHRRRLRVHPAGAPPVSDQADVGDERRPARSARPRLPGRAGPDVRRHVRRPARTGGGRVRRAPAAVLLHGHQLRRHHRGCRRHAQPARGSAGAGVLPRFADRHGHRQRGRGAAPGRGALPGRRRRREQGRAAAAGHPAGQCGASAERGVGRGAG